MRLPPLRLSLNHRQPRVKPPHCNCWLACHETAYAALLEVVRRAGSPWYDRMIADRFEQQALLAVCSHPATGSADRRAKADYLLEIEARGELDLEEHMQALLHSMQS